MRSSPGRAGRQYPTGSATLPTLAVRPRATREHRAKKQGSGETIKGKKKLILFEKIVDKI